MQQPNNKQSQFTYKHITIRRNYIAIVFSSSSSVVPLFTLFFPHPPPFYPPVSSYLSHPRCPSLNTDTFLTSTPSLHSRTLAFHLHQHLYVPLSDGSPHNLAHWYIPSPSFQKT